MNLLDAYKQDIEAIEPLGVAGRVSGVRGLTVSVSGFPAPVGATCRIGRGDSSVESQVIGFADERTLVMPLGPMTGIRRGDRVEMISAGQTVAVGQGMLGRVLDGFGRPIDGLGPVDVEASMPIWPRPTPPMQRRRIDQPLGTGVRAIDAMLTVGLGQRMGIFSGSGVGKSVLLGMIARGTGADVSVISLIGERGREVRDFIEKNLGPEGLKRAVVVVATSDESPLVRVQAGATATAVAEYFRDQGNDVLLVMDSLTRLATAQRQIGLAAGEPPATKGYTPSVFSLLPNLLERCGRTEKGSITGFYSVLVEADDLADPIADAARSVTDGHVLLSRHLASRGQYPAVDLLGSVSRVMIDVADPAHRAAAKDIQRLVALYAEIEEMVHIGAYRSEGGTEYDLAVRWLGEIRKFLAQEMNESSDFESTLAELMELHRTIFAPGTFISEAAMKPAESMTTERQ